MAEDSELDDSFWKTAAKMHTFHIFRVQTVWNDFKIKLVYILNPIETQLQSTSFLQIGPASKDSRFLKSKNR